MLDGILLGLQTVLSWHNLLLVFAGCATGTLIGMLPGLGPITAIALMIPITYGFDPASGMILLAGVYYGAIFGGSTSSILINAPGVAGTVATAFDGYPLAQQGQAGKALATAAYARCANARNNRSIAGRSILEFRVRRLFCPNVARPVLGLGIFEPGRIFKSLNDDRLRPDVVNRRH
jgi:hypothetical protein